MRPKAAKATSSVNQHEEVSLSLIKSSSRSTSPYIPPQLIKLQNRSSSSSISFKQSSFCTVVSLVYIHTLCRDTFAVLFSYFCSTTTTTTLVYTFAPLLCWVDQSTTAAGVEQKYSYSLLNPLLLPPHVMYFREKYKRRCKGTEQLVAVSLKDMHVQILLSTCSAPSHKCSRHSLKGIYSFECNQSH